MNDVMKFEMIEAMRKYGGSFVVSLADCFMRADSFNFEKLCRAFPEYVEQYLAMAGVDRIAAEQSVQADECPTCAGLGFVNDDRGRRGVDCSDCNGSGIRH